MSDTGFKFPTSTVSQTGWVVYGTEQWKYDDASPNVVVYGTQGHAYICNFGFALPAGSVVNGFEAQLKIRSESLAGVLAYLSWDGGINYSNPIYCESTFYDGWKTFTRGGPTDLWGSHVWTRDETNDTNFRVHLNMNNAGAGYGYWEYFWLKVYYSSSGGPEVLAGTIASASSVAGIPSVNAGLIGASHAVSDVRGDMGGTDVPLIGSLASASSVDAELYAIKGLRGVSRSFAYISGLMMPRYSISHNLSHVDQMLDHRLEQFK